MSALEHRLEQFRALPRSMRWALMGAAGVALFLVWDSASRPVTESWQAKADELQADLARVRSSRDLGQELKHRAKMDLVVAFGPVEIPGSEADGKKGLTDAVNEILRDYSISDNSFDLRQSGRLPKGSLSAIARGKRVTRLRGDLRFEAAVEDVTDIIAQLESSPQIESISSVRLNKLGNRRLQVYLILDTWVLSASSDRGVG
jgi:hypothetical protein